MNLLLIFFLLTPLIQGSSAIISFNAFIEVFKLLNSSADRIWDIADRVRSPAEAHKKIMKIFNDLKRKIGMLTDRIDLYGRETLNKLYDIEEQISYEIQLNNFINSLLYIETKYKLFTNYSSKSSSFESYTLMNFAKTAISHSDNSIYSNFLNINLFAFGSEYERVIGRTGLFDLINKKLSKSSSICNLSQSQSSFLTNLFFVIQSTQIKAYLMLIYSWTYLHIKGEGKFKEEIKMFKNSYINNVYDLTEVLKIRLDKANNFYLKCDPLNYIKDETYTEITKFLQGFVINEVDINPGSQCSSNCAYFSHTKQYGCYWKFPCANQPKCNGSIIGCRYHYSNSKLCLSEENSPRIYDYIKFGNNDVFGKETSLCKRSTFSYSWIRSFWHCSSCFCYCDDHTNSDRYFNLRPVISNIDKNKVITGIRFIKSNRVIHLQIQEGELIINSKINGSTVQWLPVDSYDISDNNITADIDYHTLTWNHTAIDLNDLIVPDQFIVTGVRFRRVDGHLNLEVQATSFNQKTGKLINPLNSYWFNGNKTVGNTSYPRRELKLIRPDNPTRDPEIKSYTYSENDQFVNFQHSDDIFDAAQTAVPFIDIQKVSPIPPAPLVGIGLYHKGRKYSGGFIAPKVFTYKNLEHLINFQKDLKNLLQK